MIKSFRDKHTEQVFLQSATRRLPAEILRRAKALLDLLDHVESLDELRQPPGNHLEALRGDRWGQYSLRINRQWRLCFTWRNGDADDVEICDYH